MTTIGKSQQPQKRPTKGLLIIDYGKYIGCANSVGFIELH